MKRGRKPKVEPEQLVSVLHKYKDKFVLNCLVVGPRALVYQDISAELGEKVTPGAIYTFIKQHKLAKALYKDWGLKTEDHGLPAEEEQTPANQINDGCWSVPSSEEDELWKQKFTITLSKDEWLEIAPKEYLSNRKGRPDKRAYQILTPNVWTHVINEHFWIQTKLSCCLVFKRANVSTEASVYVNIEGFCKDCNGTFCGKIVSVPNEGGRVLIDCCYESENVCQTSKTKRQIRGAVKDKVLEYMIRDNKTASAVRTKEASRLMDHGDVEPSHLPSLNSLRVAKSKAVLSELAHDDAVTSLHIAKFTTPYQASIHNIGLNKFFVHYWSPNQINVYRQYHKLSVNPTIAIDATGGLVKKLRQPFGNKSGHLFLYQSVAIGDGNNLQFPVCQMLSEAHNNVAIDCWLQEWLRSGGIVPKTVVCDRSVALLSGIVKAFTQYKSLGEYGSACYNALLQGSVTSLPNCYVRCDVAHVIKNICSWLPLKSMSKNVRSFHIRCVVEIIRSENVSTLRTLLQAMFLLTTSSTVGKLLVDSHPSILDTKAETARKYLKRLISDDSFEQLIDLQELTSAEDQAENDLFEIEREEPGSEESNLFVCWGRGIYQEVTDGRNNDEGEIDNALYCPSLVPLVMELLRDLTMISNIMRPLFQYGTDLASSARVESTFNQIKNRLFSDRSLPLRVDSFVCSHINALDGELKLVAASSPRLGKQSKSNSVNSKVKYTNADIPNTSDMHKTQTIIKDSLCPENKTTNTCPECANGRLPGGAHKCVKCKKAVHIIYESCSRSISKEEGYGEKRICVDCLNESGSKKEDYIVENWRGQGEPTEQQINKKKKENKSIKSYLIRPKEIEHLDISGKKSSLLGLLKNGNRASELKPVYLSKSTAGKETRVTASNTCALDSVTQILACAHCDSEEFQSFTKEAIANGNKFLELCKSVASHGISSGTYRKRMDLLIGAFVPVQQYQGNLLVLQCEVTIAQLLKNIMFSYPTATDSISCTCFNCPEMYSSTSNVIDVSIQQPSQVENLENELQIIFQQVFAPCSNPVCLKEGILQCNGVKSITKTPGGNLFIELINPIEKDATNVTKELKITLDDIPKTVMVADRTFRLRGVIGFSSLRKSISEVGHYVAFAYRETRQWELYDDCASKCKSVSGTKVVEVQVVVYTL